MTSSSEPRTATGQPNSAAIGGHPRGSADGRADGLGKSDVLPSTSFYTVEPECPTCGQIRVRIRKCQCGHESVYHEPPGQGRCAKGAGLSGCDCPRFTEDIA